MPLLHTLLCGTLSCFASPDSGRIHVYSFEKEKEVLAQHILPAHTAVEVGQSIFLKAPLELKGADYFWKGPNGLTAYTETLFLEKITEKELGHYTLVVRLGKDIWKGRQEIKLNEDRSLSSFEN